MLNKIKENKKIMEIKLDQANKLADEAIHEFIDSIRTLAKDASEEDFKKVLKTEDNMIESEDKLMVIAAFIETHKDVDDTTIIDMLQSLVLV